MVGQQAGWYPDPAGDISKLRYWDGAQWTSDFSDVPVGQMPGQVAQAQPAVVVQEVSYYSSGGGGTQYQYSQVYAQPAVEMYEGSSKQTMRMVAFVFAVLSTVVAGWLLLPLAWMVPMTVMSYGIYKGTRKNTTAFGVCSLLFLSLVSGILLLVSGEDQ